MKKLKKLLASLAIILVAAPTLAFAQDGGTVQTGGVAQATTTEGRTGAPTSDDLLPNVTIDDATDWADDKGADAVSFLTAGGQWFAVIIFIASAFMTLIGAIGGRAGKGLVGMFFAIVMYAGITYAPTIIDFLSQWLGQ